MERKKQKEQKKLEEYEGVWEERKRRKHRKEIE